MENYLPIPGYEGRYWVSDMGHVRSRRTVLRASGPRYLTVGLSRDGQQRTAPVHQLVLLAFRGPRPDGMVVRHLNGDSHDNRLDNLAYGSQSQNIRDAIGHGTWPASSRTHCPHGHPYDGENTWIDKTGARHCRACLNERSRKYYQDNAEKLKQRARENYRKTYVPRGRTVKTHCPQGHPFDEANTRWVNGRNGNRNRRCRTCDRENKKRYNRRS